LAKQNLEEQRKLLAFLSKKNQMLSRTTKQIQKKNKKTQTTKFVSLKQREYDHLFLKKGGDLKSFLANKF
jgi:hypothetical protein